MISRRQFVDSLSGKVIGCATSTTKALAACAAAAFLLTGLTHAQGPARESSGVLTGIDVLARDGFKTLHGKRVGLITNHTGVDRQGRSTIEVLKDAPGVKLVALFSPEHGIAGKLDVSHIPDAKDPATGLHVVSLYGETRRPSKEHLEGLDVLVFDIQDIGTRFYTYISTLGSAMEAAAEQGVSVLVLDRPNPIGGIAVQGPLLDKKAESFVGYHRMPVRHGMTIGELAMMFNQERSINVELEVVKVEGWKRHELFDQTGLTWINPSPNMRSLTQALLYPGIGLLEMTNLSVGRGTDTPFEVIGAPWLDAKKLQSKLLQAKLTGVTFVPIQFSPRESKFEGEVCSGLNIVITDWDTFDPLLTGLAIAAALQKNHPKVWTVEGYMQLLGNRASLNGVKEGMSAGEILAFDKDELAKFKVCRETFLLYR